MTFVAFGFGWVVFWAVVSLTFVRLAERPEPDDAPITGGESMDEYQKRFTKLLDQAADELNADDFDELLDTFADQIVERQDAGDDLDDDFDFGDE